MAVPDSRLEIRSIAGPLDGRQITIRPPPARQAGWEKVMKLPFTDKQEIISNLGLGCWGGAGGGGAGEGLGY